MIPTIDFERISKDHIDNRNKLSELIEEQSRQIRELMAESSECRKVTDRAQEQFECMNIKMKNINISHNMINDKINILTQRLDSASIINTSSVRSKYIYVYSIYHKTNTQQYVVINRRSACINGGNVQYIAAGYTECIYSTFTPDPISLNTRITAALPDDLCSSNSTRHCIVLNPGKTTDDLLAVVRSVEAEKKNV